MDVNNYTQNFSLDASHVPDHQKEPDNYYTFRQLISGQDIAKLKFVCRLSSDEYDEQLRCVLRMKGGAFLHSVGQYQFEHQVSGESLYELVAQQVWFGHLTIIRDLIHQKPFYWLLNAHDLRSGQWKTNLNYAHSQSISQGQMAVSPTPQPERIQSKPAPKLDQLGWVQLDIYDSTTGVPMSNVTLQITVPEGSKTGSGQYSTNAAGRIELVSLKYGKCKLHSSIEDRTYENSLCYVDMARPATKNNELAKQLPHGDYTLLRVKEYAVKDGETLSSIAQVHDTTTEALGLFNWKTTDAKQINHHLIHDVGAIAPKNENDPVVFDAQTVPGIILIPTPWEYAQETPFGRAITVKPVVVPKMVSIELNILLMDVPGPNGHGLSFVPWKLVKGEKPEAMALIDAENLCAEGETTDKGTVELTPQQIVSLSKAFVTHPHNIWLMSPGQCVQVAIQEDDPTWDADQKLLLALNASGFSETVHSSTKTKRAENELRYALQAYDIPDSQALFDQIVT